MAEELNYVFYDYEYFSKTKETLCAFLKANNFVHRFLKLDEQRQYVLLIAYWYVLETCL